MKVIGFFTVNDNIVDLSDFSSDEETVQQDHIATQPQATVPCTQALSIPAGEARQDAQAAFVAAGEATQDTQAESVAAGEARQDAFAAFVAAGEARQEAFESGNALVAPKSSPITEKVPHDTSASQNLLHSSAAAPFTSPTATTRKALTSQGSDAKVKRPRKNYHKGDTPRRSPRLLLEKHKCRNESAEELAAHCKGHRLLEQAEESSASYPQSDSAKTDPAI